MSSIESLVFTASNAPIEKTKAFSASGTIFKGAKNARSATPADIALINRLEKKYIENNAQAGEPGSQPYAKAKMSLGSVSRFADAAAAYDKNKNGSNKRELDTARAMMVDAESLDTGRFFTKYRNYFMDRGLLNNKLESPYE